MRSMMLRNPHETFGDLMREILQPPKYGEGGYGPMRLYDGDVGTKDDPSIVVRSHTVERRYKAWRDADGSYHEALIDEGLPDRPEITNGDD